MFGTPEVCKREDAGGIFPRRKVPSREREPKSEARSEAYRNATATSEIQMFGTPEGTRTPHLLLRRQLLYPDELLAHMERVMGIEPTPTAWKAVVLAVILHPRCRVLHQP